VARGRRTKGSRFRAGGKIYQWFGFSITNVVVDDAAIDTFLIVPATSSVSEQATGTLVRSLMAVRAASTNLVASVGIDIRGLLQKTEINSAGTPVGIIAPTSLNGFDLGDGDVLWWGMIELPQSTPPTVVTETTFRVMQMQSKAKRKLKLRKHGVIFSMEGFNAIDTSISLQLRCLMQY